jgi:zinc transport system ATP-binding protein
MSLLNIKGLDVRIRANTVLRHVDMTLEKGEIVTIVGPNVSGKSTLLKAIIGAVPLARGQLLRAPGLRIGYVPQSLHIDPTLPMMVRRFLSLPNRVTDDVADDALERAGVVDLGDRQMAGLSGGQFQRVLLARALLNSPDVLLLDEATQGLDQRGSAAFYRQIEDVGQNLGCAVLMISHELHVVMSASDRVICLNGHVGCEGKPEVVTNAPEYRALFGTGTKGALALYRHEYNHSHDHDHDHSHEAAE